MPGTYTIDAGCITEEICIDLKEMINGGTNIIRIENKNKIEEHMIGVIRKQQEIIDRSKCEKDLMEKKIKYLEKRRKNQRKELKFLNQRYDFSMKMIFR